MKRIPVLAALCLVSLQAGTAAEPLCDASRNNALDDVKSLAREAKDLNAGICQGHPALQYATAVGTAEAMRILIKAGADVNAKDSADATALMWAVTNIEKTGMLLEGGAEVNAVSKSGVTPLLIASNNNGSLEIIRLLLLKGADWKVKDATGTTALIGAAHSGDLSMVRFFLEKGADINEANKGGISPIVASSFSGHYDVTKYLVAKGANVNVSNTFAGKVKHGLIGLIGLTPLMLNAPYGPVEVVKAILDAGADVNARDSRGMTALMLAVATDFQNPATVKLLLDRGADASLKDKYGETALDWAKKIGNPATIKLLNGQPEKPADVKVAAAVKDVQQAMQKSFALLQKSGDVFFKESGCPACHHVNLTAVASSVVRKAGYKMEDSAAMEQAKVTKLRWVRSENALLQRQDPGGSVDTVSYGGFALGAHRMESDMATDAMVLFTAMLQLPDGSWPHSGVPRPPFEDSAVHTTATAVRLIQAYGPPARKGEWDGRVTRAKRWLAQAKPIATDARAMQVMGLLWAGATEAEVRPFTKALIAQQRRDGGWAQNPWLASDAYATGQVLFALAEAGVKDDKALHAGRNFLVATQKEDGSWFVRSRAPKFQPYFESGFPYGPDQFISNTATAWATMALARR